MWRRMTNREIKDDFPKLYESIFGYWDKKMTPRVVFVTDDMSGFVSGYRVDKETFYISWGGVKGTFLSTRKAWDDWEQTLKELGTKWLTCKIENTLTKPQRLMMGMGWIPHGMVVSGGNIYIEYYKGL